MADDDQTNLSDDEQSFLLSGSSSLDGVDFRAADGINAGNLAQTVVGTIGLALGTAAVTFVDGVAEAWTRLLGSLAGFLAGTQQLVESVPGAVQDRVTQEIPGLIGTVSDSWVSAIRASWDSALPDTGLAAWLFALGLVLITFYVAARGFDTVSEVLNR